MEYFVLCIIVLNQEQSYFHNHLNLYQIIEDYPYHSTDSINQITRLFQYYISG